ncbi:MAG TPA: hypothetical protein P5286_05445, partial [Treponemataceae bacterium]|nr:hypothetical protein [Treponemataceae bacterium]
SFNEIFFYLDVSGGTPAITITLDAETITGSLDLANYANNFDEITLVMFCTEDPTILFSDTLEEGNSQYLVGWGRLTANATNGYHDFTGTIYSEYAGSDLYLIVVGEKYGQMVLYASTAHFTVSQMIGLTPAMTPLLQYVVVYMGTTGLQSNNGDAATVSIGMSNGLQNPPPDPTVFGDGVVQKIYLNENAPQVYAVIARLTDENGYVVLESGESAIYGYETVYYITLQVDEQEPVNQWSEPVIDGAFVYVHIALP